MAVGNGTQARSCFEKVDDSHDADSTEHYGVCPLELERWLHELLEGRQQDQIAEVGFALDCAKHKLLEKEMEKSFWKDTASLISQQVPPGVSHLSRQPVSFLNGSTWESSSPYLM